MMHNDMDVVLRFGKWMEKKTKNMPAPMATLMRRTVNTGTGIVSTLRDTPFQQLSTSLYFICQDIQVAGFTRLYEAELELAGVDDDKFVKTLHKFFNDTARKIKEENLYQAFFEFLAITSKSRVRKDRPEEQTRVLDCYQSLLLQQSEYLRPNKFDLNVVLCGRTTDGELMTVPDLYPNFDEPAFEVEKKTREGWRPLNLADIDRVVRETYHRYGYTQVNSAADMERIMQMDRIYSHHHCSLMPYINEYTYDMLPDVNHAFTTYVTGFYAMQSSADIKIDDLVELLRHRSRTLPSNGAHFEFFNGMDETQEGLIISKLHMKEMLYGDTIIMLYKLETMYGELSGSYNTKDGYLFSVFQEAEGVDLYDRIRKLVLYLYATQVTRNGMELQQAFSQNFWYGSEEDVPLGSGNTIPLEVRVFGRGGRPENVYHPTEEGRKLGPRAGNDAYESETRSIQGFVRRVGAGRTPSEEARARGLALGYDLAPDETYVQPFIKTVLRLKETSGT